MYPEHQISILEGFLKDHVTLKTVMNNCRINTNQDTEDCNEQLPN